MTEIKGLPAESLNHGCTDRPIDPLFETTQAYDFKHIEDTVYRFAESEPHVKQALEVIEKAYRDYSFETISLSFNGGKDCTVLLHLVAAVLSRLGYPTQEIETVFVTYPNPFPHVDTFVKVCIERYRLKCHYIPGPMKQALQHYLDLSDPKPKAIFVGIRRNDPYAEYLTHFDKTDKGWPEFMRVHPIVDWSYKNIWGFLLELKIPYCSLYDQGFTSLGSMENTHPNPDLLLDGECFRPAFMLANEAHERFGRIGSSKK